MRVLVTGAGGMLARDLVAELERRGDEVLALSRADLDVTDEAAVRERIEGARPDVVVQCAAYTAVDRAEEEEELATRVNALGTRNVARACDRIDALLVYPSTDYVFAGDATVPYRPADAPAPVNAYGRSKLAGEEAAREAGRALVVRTSWLYGAGGANFVDTIGRLARERGAVDVVADQIGRPTWTGSLAAVVRELIASGAEGILHATDGGRPVSWHGFAERIAAWCAPGTEVRPVASSAFPRPARRPAYSVLDCSATEAVVGHLLPEWGEVLDRYLAEACAGGHGPRP